MIRTICELDIYIGYNQPYNDDINHETFLRYYLFKNTWLLKEFSTLGLNKVEMMWYHATYHQRSKKEKWKYELRILVLEM